MKVYQPLYSLCSISNVISLKMTPAFMPMDGLTVNSCGTSLALSPEIERERERDVDRFECCPIDPRELKQSDIMRELCGCH